MKLELTPIGWIHSPCLEAQGTPTQPRWATGVEGTVQVFSEFAPGPRDLDGFASVWLLYTPTADNRFTQDKRNPLP